MPYPCTRPEDVIVITTPTIEGCQITKYISLIITDKYFVNCAGRSLKEIEKEFKTTAFKIGANAVVGVSFVSASEANTYLRGYGTAVICKSPEEIQQEKELKREKEYEAKIKASKEEFEKQETIRRFSEAKIKAEENEGRFVYEAYEDFYPTFRTARELLLFIESLNITDESFINNVLPQIKEILALETFRSSQLSSALELLKQLTGKE